MRFRESCSLEWVNVTYSWPTVSTLNKDWLESEMRMLLTDYGRHLRTLQRVLWILNDVLYEAQSGKGVMHNTTVSQRLTEIKVVFGGRGFANPRLAVQVLARGITNLPVVRKHHVDQVETSQLVGTWKIKGNFYFLR